MVYGWGELDHLVPAYACTIHRSQGSDDPAVVIPLLTQHYAMLQRNLVYSGQKKALAIGHQKPSGPQALHQAGGVVGGCAGPIQGVASRFDG